MKGSYKVKISHKKIKYEFTLNRNISILTGDSATGKSKLTELIRANYLGNKVDIISKIPVYNLEPSPSYIFTLSNIRGSIIVIDENHPIYKDKYFAKYLKESDNYFLLITRNPIGAIPYSYKEIYEIVTVGNINTFKRKYDDYEGNRLSVYEKDKILVEDSGSGYKFYKKLAELIKLNVDSSKGNSNIKDILRNQRYDLVIADGSAFGSEISLIEECIKLSRIKLYLPESFEFVLLKIFFKYELEKLGNISDNVDSIEHFSWETFFEKILKDICKQKLNIQYRKESINSYFTDESSLKYYIDNISEDIIFIKYRNIEDKIEWKV